MIKVEKRHFLRAALEVGQSGENDTLPYDVDAAFIKEKAGELSEICISLFENVENGVYGKPAAFMNELTITSERLLVLQGRTDFASPRRYIRSGTSI